MTTAYDDEAPVQEIWGMWSTLLLPSLSCPLWLGVVVKFCGISMDKVEEFNHLLCLKLFKCVEIELSVLNSNTWNRVIKNISYKLFAYKSYSLYICMYLPTAWQGKDVTQD